MQNKKPGKSGLSYILISLKPSLQALQKSDPLRLAGATAFFTTFALPAIVFLLIQLLGLLAGPKTIGKAFIERIAGDMGDDAAAQVRQVIRSIAGINEKWYVLVVGLLFVIFVATTLFSVIRKSLNELWQIKVDEQPGLLYILTTRARSLGLILLAGILFLADMLSESLNMIAGKYINAVWEKGSVYLSGALSELAGLVIICTWFIFLFRFLGDGRPRWKAAIAGGILTAILFKAGKLLLWFLLIKSDVSNLYGASGSLVLVLLFVFYSSFIFYYGASFVEVYSNKLKLPIVTVDKAYRYTTEEADDENS